MFNLARLVLRTSKDKVFVASRFSYSSAPTNVQPVISEEYRKKLRAGKNGGIVAAAFASLNAEQFSGDIQTPYTDERIEKASSVNELLGISHGAGVSRRHALKVVSILADWSSNGKVRLNDFESDPRFIKLCRILTKGSYNKNRIEGARNEDLSMIMNVTADDEAAKLVASITLPQMVKVLQALATKKRRSTMLLRSLAFNITRCPDKLDIKQSADVLYSMSTLNFCDENLIERVCSDVVAGLNQDIQKSAAIGSIITSLGLLRYKDAVGAMDVICSWCLKNYEVCRPQDLSALFLTMAILNFEPSNSEKLYELLVPQLANHDSTKPIVWLELVWSLLLLNKVTPVNIAHVLSEKFVWPFEENFTNHSAVLRLLNINGASKYLVEYQGPRLNDSSKLFSIPLVRSKGKEEMVTSVLESLKNLVQNEKCINANVNTQMGFYIDAECIFDKKCTPVPFDNYKPQSDHVRVAILVHDYSDMCRGRVEPTGINVLAMRLLLAQGYKILQVPYHEYKIKDKLIHRVQYLESKLKALVQS